MRTVTDMHWLIWDGSCTFCRNAVTWMRRQDTAHAFHIVTYQKCPSPPMTPELYAAAERAVQVVTRDGRTISGGRAILFVLEEIGWNRGVVRLFARRPLIWGVEGGYWLIARNRHLASRVLFRERHPQKRR